MSDFKLSLGFVYKGVGFTTARNLSAWNEVLICSTLLDMRKELDPFVREHFPELIFELKE